MRRMMVLMMLVLALMTMAATVAQAGSKGDVPIGYSYVPVELP